jgi:PAS domain S-box-containing protein
MLDDTRHRHDATSVATEDRELRARILNALLKLLMVGLAAGTLVTALGYSRASYAVALSLIPVLSAAWLARRGRLLLPIGIVLGTMLALATWLLARGDGIQDIAVLLFPVIVLIAGLLLDRRPFALVVLASILAIASIALAQWRGLVRVPSELLRRQLPADALVAALTLSVAAAMIHLMAEQLRRSLRQARESEAALAAGEERYRLITEVMSDYTFSTRVDPDGSVHQEWVAGAFERMTGYPFQEFLARGGWRAALYPEDRAQDDRDLRTLQSNRPVVSELRTLSRSGDVRWVRVYGHPVWSDEEGRLVGIYGAVQDVSERKRVEVEREALIRELEAKNAELERFTYTASHDLKSPLVTVRGFLSYLERDAVTGNHERLRSDIQRIRDATAKMQRLLDELLELSRVGRVVSAPKSISLGALAREGVELIAGRLEQGGVKVSVAPDLPEVWGDRVRLLQVMQNLLDNAVKFMGDQSRPTIEIGYRPEGSVVYVRDNGVGVEGRYQDRIFGLFDKLDPDSSGSGVGLALVRRIVELHGGRAWVESEGRGQGATFCFTLPPPPPVDGQLPPGV